MAERPAARPGTAPSAVDRAEALMARHREAAARAARAAALEPAPAAPQIPTLTDLVSGPPLDVDIAEDPAVPVYVAPLAEPPPPQAPDPAIETAPVLSDEQRRALEEAVFERVRARLDAEMSDLLGRQLVPELAARLDAATQSLAAQLREAIPAAVEQALRERTPPRDD